MEKRTIEIEKAKEYQFYEMQNLSTHKATRFAFFKGLSYLMDVGHVAAAMGNWMIEHKETLEGEHFIFVKRPYDQQAVYYIPDKMDLQAFYLLN